jgi:hypothetical protein
MLCPARIRVAKQRKTGHFPQMWNLCPLGTLTNTVKPRVPDWLETLENRKFTTEVHFFCNKIANGG